MSVVKQHLLLVWHGIDQTIIERECNWLVAWTCSRVCGGKSGHFEQLLWHYLAIRQETLQSILF